MTPDEQTILMFKGLIADLSEDQQARVKEAEARLTAVLEEYKDEGLVAFGLIGAKLQCK